MKEEIADIVKQSHPECGLHIACNTKCGECGAGRIIDLLESEIEKLENPFYTDSARRAYEHFRRDMRKLLEEE